MSTPAPAAVGTALLDPDPALHLLRRATFGASGPMLADIRRRGLSAWLDSQLAPASIGDPAVSAFLIRYPTLGYSAAQLAALTDEAARKQAWSEVVEATLVRQIWSTRQLFEVMCDFWSNHFNVLAGGARMWTTKPIDDRTVIRTNALGSFADLLLADARSPAMLIYLGNDRSQLDRANENYGRELLELHTVGLGAGFTEADVRNSAYVLTGRSCDERGLPSYRADYHYVGPVQVMGWSSPNDSAEAGAAVGDSYLSYLARHPSTALSLSRKLAIRFVSDNPPRSLVDRLAGVYLANDTAIVPWLRALFNSTEFAASVGAKVRRPLEDMAATIRAMGIGLPTGPNKSAITDLRLKSAQLEHVPFGYPWPTGYPDAAASWYSVGSTVARWNVHRSLITGNPVGLDYPPLVDLLAGPPLGTYGDFVDRLTLALTDQVFRADHRQALLSAWDLAEGGPYDAARAGRALPTLTALVLDSPYLMLR